MNILDHINRVIDGLNAVEQEYLLGIDMNGNIYNKWYMNERSKYVAIDCGNSGAFLVDKLSGELFNIKGYGVPDKNKKIKANLGNITTVNPRVLHSKRWNYLR